MTDRAKNEAGPEDDPAVRARARQLWEQDGSPAGQADAYYDKASELLAIERNQQATLKPNPRHSPEQPGGAEPVEPPEALENQGELPGLADQGEESPHPPGRHPRDRTDR